MWEEGSFRGFRARGGVTVNANWNTESVDVELVASRGGRFKVRYGAAVREITLEKGRPANLTLDTSQL
jgi:hypothetical protein